MLEILKAPWPWYVSGAGIAAVMLLLTWFGKSFGFSSNLSTLCSMMGAGKRVPFFGFDWRTQKWNLLFLIGAVAGGALASLLMHNPASVALSAATVQDLEKLHIAFDGDLNPRFLFGTDAFGSAKSILLLLTGGLLVGFGTRYAGGCTSGHAISGLSNLQFPSLLAVAGFFIGGLIMTHLLFPLIF